MKQKPEISYDRENRQFQQDGKPITLEQAITRWDAIDSDWTQGAYRMMWTLVINTSPGHLHEENAPQ
jgi:hypothetical protein